MNVLATKEDIITIRKYVISTREDIANIKAVLIKWMFIFWIGQVAVTFGFILMFLKR